MNLKHKKTFNELAIATLTDTLTGFDVYDNRELELKFRKGTFIHFYNLILTQERFNVDAMMKLSRKEDPESKDTLRWVTKGVQIFHSIRDTLTDTLDPVADSHRNNAKIIGKLKVYEWQYIAYMCHLFIDQLGDTKKEHRSLQTMFYVTEIIGNEIAKLPVVENNK